MTDRPKAPRQHRDPVGRLGTSENLRVMTRQLRVGDRLVSNPCDMIVRSLGARTTPGLAWCRNCAAEHIVDVRLFNSGRGPWKREEVR